VRHRVAAIAIAAGLVVGLAACSPTDVMRCYGWDGRSFITDRATADANHIRSKCVEVHP
jgi:hypothetical protein